MEKNRRRKKQTKTTWFLSYGVLEPWGSSEGIFDARGAKTSKHSNIPSDEKVFVKFKTSDENIPSGRFGWFLDRFKMNLASNSGSENILAQ